MMQKAVKSQTSVSPGRLIGIPYSYHAPHSYSKPTCTARSRPAGALEAGVARVVPRRRAKCTHGAVRPDRREHPLPAVAVLATRSCDSLAWSYFASFGCRGHIRPFNPSATSIGTRSIPSILSHLQRAET